MDDEFDHKIRFCQARLNDAYIDLLATTDVIMGDLRGRLRVVKDVSVTLAETDALWAKSCAQRLQDAVRAAEIKRPDADAVRQQDREAKILLSLPKNTEETISEWLREMNLTERNSDWLFTASRYVLDRLRSFVARVENVASELSAIDTSDAQACAAQLRGAAPASVPPIRAIPD
jgi:hypothetical protein